MQIEVLAEDEYAGGWSFHCQAIGWDGSLIKRTIRLAWADYNHWSDGGDEPSSVAAAVLRFLLSRRAPGEVRDTYDAARARREFDDADDVIPQMISR